MGPGEGLCGGVLGVPVVAEDPERHSVGAWQERTEDLLEVA
jgi:hypothetical protein